MPWRILLPALALLAFLVAGCGDRRSDGPNILFVCWDTVRADRLGLYGCAEPTSPFLDAWAKDARVFEDCISAANCTVPTHVSWFTGLMPGEHGRTNRKNLLDDRFETLAELLQGSGYRTYMFSANPHIVRKNNFDQGFDCTEHPWDKKYKSAAIRGMDAKRARGESGRPRLPASRMGQVSPLEIKDGGVLARKGLLEFLRGSDDDKPWFAFLNYMEAHLPCTPSAPSLERLAESPGVAAGASDPANAISWADLWCYSLGTTELSEEQLARAKLKYDACVNDLDTLLKDLITFLEKAGELENTIIVVTADHGEHHGEHHLLDHQYSIHEPLVRVPLVVLAPGRFEPGRDSRPVTTTDLFPTLLEAAGVNVPGGITDKATSLFRPEEERIRVAECPFYPDHWFSLVRKHFPDFDPAPYRRTFHAVYKDRFKMIAGSDGSHALYDLAGDPGELDDLASEKPEMTGRMKKILEGWIASFEKVSFGPGRERILTEEEKRLLQGVGY